MSDTLKPCPFCGSPPRVQKRQDESLWSHNIVTWTAVGCPECEIEFDWPEGGESNAAEEWNRRAAEYELAALALSLAEALDKINASSSCDRGAMVARGIARKALASPALLKLRGKE